MSIKKCWLIITLLIINLSCKSNMPNQYNSQNALNNSVQCSYFNKNASDTDLEELDKLIYLVVNSIRGENTETSLQLLELKAKGLNIPDQLEAELSTKDISKLIKSVLLPNLEKYYNTTSRYTQNEVIFQASILASLAYKLESEKKDENVEIITSLKHVAVFAAQIIAKSIKSSDFSLERTENTFKRMIGIIGIRLLVEEYISEDISKNVFENYILPLIVREKEILNLYSRDLLVKPETETTSLDTLKEQLVLLINSNNTKDTKIRKLHSIFDLINNKYSFSSILEPRFASELLQFRHFPSRGQRIAKKVKRENDINHCNNLAKNHKEIYGKKLNIDTKYNFIWAAGPLNNELKKKTVKVLNSSEFEGNLSASYRYLKETLNLNEDLLRNWGFLIQEGEEFNETFRFNEKTFAIIIGENKDLEGSQFSYEDVVNFGIVHELGHFAFQKYLSINSKSYQEYELNVKKWFELDLKLKKYMQGLIQIPFEEFMALQSEMSESQKYFMEYETFAVSFALAELAADMMAISITGIPGIPSRDFSKLPISIQSSDSSGGHSVFNMTRAYVWKNLFINATKEERLRITRKCIEIFQHVVDELWDKKQKENVEIESLPEMNKLIIDEIKKAFKINQ